MTAEKMRLDRFCQHGEYLAYQIALPREPDLGQNETAFVFNVELENMRYTFNHDYIDEPEFDAFERHLSRYLNVLFERKQEFERGNELFKEVMEKVTSQLSTEEQHCLATNIDANTTTVLKALGVVTE